MKLTLTLALSVLAILLHAQSAGNVNPDNKESFKLLPKSTIRQEVASFSTCGVTWIVEDKKYLRRVLDYEL